MRLANWLRPGRPPIAFAFCALFAAASPAASATPWLSEMLQRMEEHAATYERHTNAEMMDIVFAGIHSDDAAVVRHTVETITWEAKMASHHRGQIEQAIEAEDAERTAALREGLPPARNFAAVPGMRDFLLDYVRQGVAKDGWQAAVSTVEDMTERPAWASVPGALSTFFPGDPEGEKLLLEFYRALLQENPEAASHALHLLNVGRFASAELTATRIEALEHPSTWVARHAAAGLGASLTDEGLTALGAGLGRRDEALGEVVLAVLAYGARAKPYLPILRELHRMEEELAPFLTPLPIYPDGVFPSLNRVELLANRHAYLGPESLDHVYLLDDIIANQKRHDDQEVNDIVFQGIYSGDAAAVAHTVKAIGRATVTHSLRDWLSLHAQRKVAPPGNVLGEQMRSFDKVLGLRDFLLAYVRRGMADDGVAAFAAEKPPAWTFGCHTLAVLFPSDREVRQVLLALHDEFQQPGHNVNGPLRMLNAGRFYGSDVDARRTAALHNANPLAAQAAAQGLAMTLTAEGLQALVGTLERRDAAAADVAQAIGMFGARALPHRDQLRELANRGGFTSAAVEDSLAKVVANMGTIAATLSKQPADTPSPR